MSVHSLPPPTFEGISPAVITPEWVFQLVACEGGVGGVGACICVCVSLSLCILFKFDKTFSDTITVISVKL